MNRLTIFWILHLTATAVFIVGVWIRVATWLQGRVPGAKRDSAGAKLAQVWRVFWRTVFSRKLGPLLKSLILDGLVHRRLLKDHPLRWAMHFMALSGFIALFALSVVTGVVDTIMKPIFGEELIEHSAFLTALVVKDHPFLALSNEIIGLVLTLGITIALVRRYIFRPKQLRTGGPDTILLVFLAVTTYSGYFQEAFRLLMEQVTPPQAWYSFLGYSLALLLKPLNWPWEAVHYWFFLFHSTVATVLIAYLPWSKLFHVFASPIVATANTLAAETKRP